MGSEMCIRDSSNKLFLIDGLGALLSAIMLGVVLPRFEAMIGMPPKILYVLAFLACLFAIYSLSCFFRNMENWKPYLKFIAIVNLLYCCLTLGCIIFLHQEVTVLGMIYFIVEIIIIVILAIIELRTAS